MEGVFLTLTQLGSPTSSLLVTDINVGSGGRYRGGRDAGYARPGAVYVPTTGSVTLLYTSDVALSFETGVIRGFISAGRLSATFGLGDAAYEGFRSRFGWADYNDSATATTPITLTAGDWVQITNDTLGDFTNTDFLPSNATRLWDPATNTVLLDEMSLGDSFLLRADIIFNPTVNNTRLEFRIRWPGIFSLAQGLAPLGDGAGADYERYINTTFYLGSEVVRDTGAVLEVKASSGCSAQVNGFYIKNL